MIISNLINFLELHFPISLQESYDNCGLLLGDDTVEIKGVLISLDVTEKVVEEAIEKNCNVIISHHPIIFKGIKNLSKKNYTNRVLIKCIQNNIALYAIHTNLDNHINGVNSKIAEKINLINTKILQHKKDALLKLVVYMPTNKLEVLDNAIFESGGGKIGNYSECHFRNAGIGTFTPNEKANPTLGKKLIREQVDEFRVEYLVPIHSKEAVYNAMIGAHPYEEVAHEWISIQNLNQDIGSGIIGDLVEEISVENFLNQIKETFQCGIIKFSNSTKNNIKKVAVCGGSGSFLITEAKSQKADVYITSDVKYHDFFEGENQLIIADIGHYESEQFTGELIAEKLKENFSNFAIHLTEINTNPINYL